MKIELHSDEATAQEPSFGNKVSYSSLDVLAMRPLFRENFHTLVFPFVSYKATCLCTLCPFPKSDASAHRFPRIGPKCTTMSMNQAFYYSIGGCTLCPCQHIISHIHLRTIVFA